MDKKELLAKATEKLERRPFPLELLQANETTKRPEQKADTPTAKRALPEAESTQEFIKGKRRQDAAVIEPVVKKGITLRPTNIKKLEELELSLRNRGLKPSCSGLIQIAIDRLEDGPQLEEECRKLIERDLRFR
ncbi:MAG TPA: hypothetical protein VIS99_01050 [Terrimicrobiaceae bacterium]